MRMNVMSILECDEAVIKMAKLGLRFVKTRLYLSRSIQRCPFGGLPMAFAAGGTKPQAEQNVTYHQQAS